jgi:hypothetical protein
MSKVLSVENPISFGNNQNGTIEYTYEDVSIATSKITRTRDNLDLTNREVDYLIQNSSPDDRMNYVQSRLNYAYRAKVVAFLIVALVIIVIFVYIVSKKEIPILHILGGAGSMFLVWLVHYVFRYFLV